MHAEQDNLAPQDEIYPLTTELQAVILASGNDGDNLYPLTEQLSPALLPVANRKLISYQLELLERARGFRKVFVLTFERWLSELSKYITEQFAFQNGYKGQLQVDSHEACP